MTGAAVEENGAPLKVGGEVVQVRGGPPTGPRRRLAVVCQRLRQRCQRGGFLVVFHVKLPHLLRDTRRRWSRRHAGCPPSRLLNGRHAGRRQRLLRPAPR